MTTVFPTPLDNKTVECGIMQRQIVRMCVTSFCIDCAPGYNHGISFKDNTQQLNQYYGMYRYDHFCWLFEVKYILTNWDVDIHYSN